MDNSTNKGDKDNSPAELDLSDLQHFNFADNWSEETPAGRDRERSPREGRARSERQPDRRPPRKKRSRDEREEREGQRGDRRPERAYSSERGPGREGRPALNLLRDCPFDIQIFPEEPILATLTKAMRHSLRTYELFEVARLILEKSDRFHVSVRWKDQPGQNGGVLFQSVPDGLPFRSEEAAVDHVFAKHLDAFFSVEEVEVDPPKGNFQFIARCTLTGEFLGPPNYHRYQSILLQYYQDRFADMSFDRFRSHVETVSDEEAVQTWLQSMTKQKRYTLRGTAEGEAMTFGSPEEARAHLVQHRKDRVVRSTKAVRFPGKRLDEVADPEIKRYIEAYAEQQKRFPLDTANTLRGRLRRQHFFIYKKGARGVSYVCAVKRRFRQPEQVFSETIQPLIAFIEENDQIVASQLREKFLGLAPHAEGEELDPEAEARLKRLNLDLRWLLSEGLITEYSDGRLSAHGVLPESRAPDRSNKGKAGRRQGATEGEKAAEDATEPASGEAGDQADAEEGSQSQEPSPAAASETAAAPAGEADPEPVVQEEKKPEEVSSAGPAPRPREA